MPTPREIELIAKADMANVTLLNLLLMFLESKGLAKQSEFIAYLDAQIRHVDFDQDREALTLLSMKIDALRLEPKPDPAGH